MKHRNLGLMLGIAAAALGLAVHAGEHHTASTDDLHADSGMQAVPVTANAGEPGRGWRYYSDAREVRAVVISPAGVYYYSRGKGLRRVFTPAA